MALEIDGVGLIGAEPRKGKNSRKRGEETRKKEEGGRRETKNLEKEIREEYKRVLEKERREGKKRVSGAGVGFFWFLILQGRVDSWGF
jgi:hypothetical protein